MNDQQHRWVYGVVPADASLEELARRERLPEVWVVEMGELAAIVGNPPEDDAKATRDQALAHARVLEAAIIDAPVVPLRFGTIVPGGDSEVASQLLEARHDELAQLLNRLEDRIQLTLKVDYDQDTVLGEIIDAEPEIAKLREQSRQSSDVTGHEAKVRLGELISTALQQRQQRDKSRIFEQLKPVSIAAVDEAPETEFMVLNSPFLVERGRIQEFEQAVERAAEERRELMQFRLLGPMPAYNFLDLEEPARM
jgi:hypothetical protein